MESWVLIKTNRIAYLMNTVICGALAVGYMMDLLKGRKSLGFIAIFMTFLVLQLIICSMKFFGNKESDNFKYYSLAGFVGIYCFAIFASDTYFTYVYALPIMIPYILYHDANLIRNVGIGAIVLNISKVIFQLYHGHNTDDDITSYTVQMAVIVIGSILMYAGTKLIITIGDEKVRNITEYTEILEENSAQLRNSVNEQLTKTQDISNFSDAIKDLAEKMTEISQQTLSELDLEIKNLSQLQNEAAKVTERSMSVHSGVKQLDEIIDGITSNVKAISTIASNTNLLAINASIEAVRSGDGNQGFSVVAQEVKRLASESNESADNITLTMSDLSSKTTHTLEDVNFLIESNASQNKAISAVESTCSDIAADIGELSRILNELNSQLKNLLYANQNIVENTQRITEIAERSKVEKK